MMETLKSLAKLRHGKFGKIRAGFDWYPDCPESEVRKERSIEIVMHPDTARDLAGLSRILRLGNLPDMDIDLQVGAVSGETLCNMTLSLLDREIAYGESENGGPAEYEWDGMDDVHYAVKVNSSEVRIEIRNEDDFPLGVSVFDPDRLASLIQEAADSGMDERAKGPCPS